MKAQVLYITNQEEIEIAAEKAEQLNLPDTSIPEEKYGWHEFLFRLDFIHCACRNLSGNINIYLPSGKWILEYNKDLWIRIKTHLEDK